MAWPGGPKMRAVYRREADLARAVVGKLRALGYDARTFDIRQGEDGKRLIPANAKCGPGWILVRAMGHALSASDLFWMRSNQPCFVQHGAADIEKLVIWCELLRKPHWNSHLSPKD